MAVVAGTVVATLLAVASPAQAAVRSYDTGYAGVPSTVGIGSGWGQITWLNRSVQVSGKVDDRGNASYYSQVIFEAYVGALRVDRQTRSINNNVRGYGFTLDGSAYRGGITRVKIDACVFRAGTNALWGCTLAGPRNLYRP
ncbi:hypothetical protein [Phytohabitans kaempferiae]|uniref:Uncharacterized protein n=1 Tax=Phytohabitans kaempferiae TaxID=1620943 RepID=A0ABV6LXE8_9ACTN